MTTKHFIIVAEGFNKDLIRLPSLEAQKTYLLAVESFMRSAKTCNSAFRPDIFAEAVLKNESAWAFSWGSFVPKDSGENS